MKVFTLTALIDLECTNSCINQTFIEKKKINTQNYKNLILYYNIDGFQNKARTIIEFVEVKLNIEDYSEQIYLVVIKLEKASLFLGYDWLQKHNLVINWSKFTLLFERYPFSSRRMFWNREPEEGKNKTEDQEEQILVVNVGE